MNRGSSLPTPSRYTIAQPAPHSLHKCQSAVDFRQAFEAFAGFPVQNVADQIVIPGSPRAVFLVGSLPLGMSTSDSDIDFIVLIDQKTMLLDQTSAKGANTGQRVAFSNDSESLVAGNFITLVNGAQVDVTVVITPAIKSIHTRLRSRGPELNKNEIMTLSRLSTGWHLWESEDYLDSRGVSLTDPALDIYCCTRNFVLALLYRRKALKALSLGDLPVTLYLGHLSVEEAYSAYYASEGFSYLGVKWLSAVTRADGTVLERVPRHSLLEQNVPLLFPSCEYKGEEAAEYLRAVREFLNSIRALIERKTLFRIAFAACPQIYPV
jgi:hypothetical protein